MLPPPKWTADFPDILYLYLLSDLKWDVYQSGQSLSLWWTSWKTYMISWSVLCLEDLKGVDWEKSSWIIERNFNGRKDLCILCFKHVWVAGNWQPNSVWTEPLEGNATMDVTVDLSIHFPTVNHSSFGPWNRPLCPHHEDNWKCWHVLRWQRGEHVLWAWLQQAVDCYSESEKYLAMKCWWSVDFELLEIFRQGTKAWTKHDSRLVRSKSSVNHS